MSRIFVSHSSRDNRQAQALRAWLVAQDPPLANEIFLDTDPGAGLKTGMKWKNELISANARCEAVICLLSRNWESSPECLAEYRTAENLGKQIFPARLESGTGGHTAEWQHCDLFTDGLDAEAVETVPAGDGAPVAFARAGLRRLREAIRGAGIAAENFVWPPPRQPDRAPYRGWEPFEEVDAGVFFGRDTQIVRALDTLRGMRSTALDSLFVVLGPSGSGKSSFLRAGLLPRLRREECLFVPLDIMRPKRHALTGEAGLAQAIYNGRLRLGLQQPALGDIEAACTGDPTAVRALLSECRRAAAESLPDRDPDVAPPILVLPLDQAEELFSSDAGPEADAFLDLIGELGSADGDGQRLGLVVAATIRTDRYEVMQTAPGLVRLTSAVFDDLKPMPDNQFRQVITGPATRTGAGPHRLSIAPDLVDQLLEDAAGGGDALPLLALTLRRLYERYGATGELTLANYEAMGGIRRVVQNAIDEVLTGDPTRRSQQLGELRAAFIPWLATVNPDNDQPMRRVANWTDLPEASRPLIQQFVEKRLLVKDQRGAQVVVEVALESLLRQWDALAGWLRDESRQLKTTDDVLRNAADWEKDGRNPDWLLTGTRLADAEALAAKPGYRDRLEPSRAYLAVARNAENQRLAAEEERRQAELRHAEERREAAEALAAGEQAHAAVLRKRSRTLRLVLAATLVIAAAAAFGFVQASYAKRQADARAREAKTLRLVSDAQSMLADLRPGGDARAFQELLAADDLVTSDVVDSALLDALLDRTALNKVATIAAPVASVAYSPKGDRIVAGSVDNMLRFFDAATGQSVGSPVNAGDRVDAVAYSPDGRRIVSAQAATLRVWDAATGQPVGAPIKRAGFRTVAVSPDGRHIVADSGEPDLAIWDIDSGHRIATLRGHSDSVTSVAYRPDGLRIASGSDDGTVRIWDAITGRPVGEITGDFGIVYAVAYSPDGSRVVSGSVDNTVRIWDADTGQPVGRPLTGHSDYVRSVVYSPDGLRIASGSDDRTVRIWNAATGQPVGAPLLGNYDAVTSVAFSPDGLNIVSGSADRTVRIWDGQGRQSLGASEPARHRIRSFELVLSGRNLSALLAQNDLLKQALHRPIDPSSERLPTGSGVTSNTAFSPDRRRYVIGAQDGSVRVYDAATGEPIGKPFTGHQDWVYAVAYGPDGRRIVSGSADKTIRVWDADTGRPIGQPVTGHTAAVLGVAVSPDGRRIASSSDDKTVRLWDADTGQPVGAPMTGHTQGVMAIAFSPDGRLIASASDDKTVRLWDAGTGQPVGAPMTGHAGYVTAVAFSPDGRHIASGGTDKTVRLWDTATALPLGKPLTGHDGIVMGVEFPDDGRIVSGDDGGTTETWPGPSAWHGLICNILTANMSRQQWNDWVLPDIPYRQACPGLPVPADSA